MAWTVAIIGGGPGGLAAALALQQLNVPGQPPVVDWTLYEKKPAISETGGGLSVQRHTWRLLERLGAAGRLDARQFFRSSDGTAGEHRDAVTGELLARNRHDETTPLHEISCRVQRSILQAALLAGVDPARVRVDHKLETVEEADGRFRLTFANGVSTTAHLVVGADGIRSVVRLMLAPDHKLTYTGQSAYRTVVSADDVAAINGIPQASVFWQYVGGKYVYTSPLGGGKFEVTARLRPGAADGALAADPVERERAGSVSWGRPVDLHGLLPRYAEFAPPVRAILQLAADTGGVQEFAMFGGVRLPSVVKTGPSSSSGIALLGDASHPLSGAFGAGAGFAFEDAYTLAQTLGWAHRSGRPLASALAVYDRARSPHYAKLYETLDRGGALAAAVAAENRPLHDEIAERVKRVWTGGDGAGWVYEYRVDEVLPTLLAEVEAEEAAKKGQEAGTPAGPKAEKELPTRVPVAAAA